MEEIESSIKLMTVESKINHCSIHQFNIVVCESELKARVLIFGVLTFLFLQLAAGQDPECTNALLALANAGATSCTSDRKSNHHMHWRMPRLLPRRY